MSLRVDKRWFRVWLAGPGRQPSGAGPVLGICRARPLPRSSPRCAPPAEIIFLRAITPAHPSNHADIIFDITEGNLRDSFDIIKRYMDGMTVGE